MTAVKPILYSYYRSSASWRVRIALAFKGISYEYRATDMLKDGGAQNTEVYKAVNPMAQVPTLIIDGLTLTQSLPIIEYLEETKPGVKLLPEDPAKRAKVRAIAEIINSGIQPLQNLSVLLMLAKISGDDSKKAEWAKYWIMKGFAAIERNLETCSGKYCVNDEVSLADLCLVPQVSNAKRFQVDLVPYPTIRRINDELVKLDAFRTADAACQPDSPVESAS